jgi:hypothetical protein
MPRSFMWRSAMTSSTSRTGASGMRCCLAIANASILPSVREHHQGAFHAAA